MFFITHRVEKVGETQKALDRFLSGVRVQMNRDYKKIEIRSDDPTKIAEHAAYEVLNQGCTTPFIIDDSGLFIQALSGFPGSYSAWALKKLGLKRILKLMEGEAQRDAYFMTALAFGLPDYKDLGQEKPVIVFEGRVEGTITTKIRGNKGFAFDPIFVPKGYEKTFAEDENLKNRVSHRVAVVNAFATWLKQHPKIIEYLKGDTNGKNAYQKTW